MLILLPPSETKRDGGDLPPLDLAALSFPSLGPGRRKALAGLAVLSRSRAASVAGLKLGPTQLDEVERNRAVRRSPTTPAIDRYTGVLYDALDAPTLDAQEREFAASTLVVHSALFGLVGALDPIPAYRLSHDSRMQGFTLKRLWEPFVSPLLASRDDLVLDFRSEGYVALGPGRAPTQHFLRVVTGEGRALNHFNKHAKGELTRAILRSRTTFGSADELVGWGPSAGLDLRQDPSGDLVLVV